MARPCGNAQTDMSQKRVPVPFAALTQLGPLLNRSTLPSDVVVIVSGCCTLIASTLIACWPSLPTARTVKLKKPVCAGAPVIAPVVPRVRPVGSGLDAGASDHTTGEMPVDVSCAEYCAFIAPFGN